MKSSLASSALIAAAMALPSASFAALPTGKLEFVTPTATVGPEEKIELRIRFTLDSASPALTFGSNPLTGFAAEDLPTQGTYLDTVTGEYSLRDFASFNGAMLNTAFGCSGTFTDVCDPSANYAFEFWTSSQPGQPSINFLQSFSLAAGASTEYLFGSFLPAKGGAAAGTYIFYNSYLDLIYSGQDADGNPLTYYHNLGQTCDGSSPAGCGFTRTVITSAVPEPSGYSLMLSGMLVAGMGLRGARGRSKV
jgi:hypothetical protein